MAKAKTSQRFYLHFTQILQTEDARSRPGVTMKEVRRNNEKAGTKAGMIIIFVILTKVRT